MNFIKRFENTGTIFARVPIKVNTMSQDSIEKLRVKEIVAVKT